MRMTNDDAKGVHFRYSPFGTATDHDTATDHAYCHIHPSVNKAGICGTISQIRATPQRRILQQDEADLWEVTAFPVKSQPSQSSPSLPSQVTALPVKSQPSQSSHSLPSQVTALPTLGRSQSKKSHITLMGFKPLTM